MTRRQWREFFRGLAATLTARAHRPEKTTRPLPHLDQLTTERIEAEARLYRRNTRW